MYEIKDSLRFDPFSYFRSFVDSTIIHYDDGVWARKRLHFLQEAVDESNEKFRVVSPLYNEAIENAIQ